MLNNIDEYPLEAHEQAEKNKIVITRWNMSIIESNIQKLNDRCDNHSMSIITSQEHMNKVTNVKY
jgi:hypothetical protein